MLSIGTWGDLWGILGVPMAPLWGPWVVIWGPLGTQCGPWEGPWGSLRTPFAPQGGAWGDLLAPLGTQYGKNTVNAMFVQRKHIKYCVFFRPPSHAETAGNRREPAGTGGKGGGVRS